MGAEPKTAGGLRWIALVAIVVGLLAPSPDAYGAGELDPTFDGDGKLTTDFGAEEGAADVAVQPDGKIVAAGSSSISTIDPYDFALDRYNPDGSLDTTFSGDGRVITNFGSSDFARSVAIQADGKIVVAGSTGSGNFALARYDTNGRLDSTFDGDGKVVTNFGGSDLATDVAIQADGKIVAAGRGNTDFQCCNSFALARYNPDGSLDPTFDTDGKTLGDFAGTAFAMAIQSDGKIVAAGVSSGPDSDPEVPFEFALARYTIDGSVDPSFGGDGKVLTDFSANDTAHDVAVQLDGKIVAAGESGDSGDSAPQAFALARYRSDGSLDPLFGGDGKVETSFGTDIQGARGVTIQSDGKIVTSGFAFDYDTLGDFALTRYNPNGNLDTSFDLDGRLLTDFGGNDGAGGLTLQADGKIAVAGATGASASPDDFALARYLAQPQISITDLTKLEGNAGVTTFSFTVSLSSPSSDTITVTRQTAHGSASAPSDYTPLNAATFTFSPGQTTKTAIVKVKGDVAVEPNETFFVNLSNPTNATIADGQGKGTIVNDDLSDSAPCTITGTNRDDVLNGTSGNDVICGGRGDDQIYGLGGNDILKGESGNDLLVGGIGYDLLIGDVGSDDLRGEEGNDTLRGGDRDDTVNGGAGSDALFGDAGADSLNSQDGVSANDSADGGIDTDSCVFDSGDFVTSCP